MKKSLVMALVAAAMLLGGCSGKAPAATTDTASNDNAETVTEESEDTSSEDTEEAEDDTSSDEDLTVQIQGEVSDIIQKSASLSEELVGVNKLYDKYDELCTNAENQTEMNQLSQWRTLVWKTEIKGLLERIEEKDVTYYEENYPTYQEWEDYVTDMAEKMSYTYEGGSIYPSMVAYNEAMRCKNEAYGLASALAGIIKEDGFVFPDSTRCGFYGDYTKDSYLIITEGMENGTYNILIHIDDSKVISGTGEVEDAADSDTYLLFTSEDGKVKGTVSHDVLGSDFNVTESDGSVVKTGDSYSFSFRY
ncbi:MAG: hypothetical protein IIZ61_09130 [Lachnospiraceae bacterium]|nr:hypothetical protein [Lachnospiraceae bacterium]